MPEIIGTDEMKRKVDSGSATVVEALSEEAFERSHIPGAINIPAGKVKELAPSGLPDKAAEIVVYCAKPT